MSTLNFSKNKLKTNRILIFLLGIFVFSFFVFGFLKDTKPSYVLAQSGMSSPDAIAIRVIPNSSHQSVSRWYKEQGFKGSPQALTIDGYDALRDGRTVYVNATNVSDTNLYTNIYLISYNQDADNATKSILDQIISHWKFNSNKTDTGYCAETTKVCLIDADCPNKQYCGSPKAKITRDTKRLADLAEMEIAIENYKRSKGYYPKLTSGTYLPGKTISTWPSWQQTLAKDLGTGLPTDPINKLGGCNGFDSITCWKESTKEFADPTPADNEFNLPNGSNTFVYTAASDGSSYNICGVMESGLVTALDEGACSGSASATTVQYVGETTNNNPVINCGTLVGNPGKLFKGYISASDSDGDTLSWTMNNTGVAWLDNVFGNTTNPNQKEINGTAGPKGVYSLDITVSDNRGGTETKTCSINITNSALPVVTPMPDKEIVIGKTLDFTIYASDPTEKYPLTFAISPSLTCTVQSGRNCHINQAIGNSFSASPGGTNNSISVRATNSLGISSPVQSFNLKVINHKPIIAKPLGCATSVRINNTYQPCTITAADSDGHSIKAYNISSSPANSGLTIDTNGIISGTPTVAGNYTITVTAVDQYDAVSEPENFVLTVKTYCGDNIRQVVNDEGKSEECDRSDKAGKNCVTAYPSQYTGGTLNCNSECKFDDSQCVNTFNISGNVKDYATASNLSGVTIEARDSGGNIIKSAVTDANGNYLLADVPALVNYNVIASITGFTNGDSGTFSLDGDKVFNFSLTGAGTTRAAQFVLTWTNPPRDLDSHLKFIVGAIPVHIYYPSSNKSGGGAWLDRDDTNSGTDDNDHTNGLENVGIETIEIDSGQSYRYFIHDYTNEKSFVGAKVEVYNSGGIKIKTYTSNHTGSNYWYVFDMDDTGRIIDKNIYQNTEP
jgi:hypothetical protein